MTTNAITKAPVALARWAGVAYFLQIPLAVFGNFYMAGAVVVPGDLAATIGNLTANAFLVRLSVVSAILAAVDTVITAMLMYYLFRSVHRTWALSIVIFTLVVTPITLLNELNKVAMLALAEGSLTLAAFTPGQIQALVQTLLTLQQFGMYIIGIFWGLWLLPMGYLVIRSNFIPKTIGVLLIVGCAAYLIDFFTLTLMPGFPVVLASFTFLGEVLMVFWLLIWGVNVKKWERQASLNADTGL